MGWTTKQKYDLDNMNVAAQNVALGTAIAAISGSLTDNYVASGSVTPSSGEREVVVTGLTTVSKVVASLSGSPTYDHAFITASAGSVAGVVILQSWNGAYTSASVQFAPVNWVAVGTL